MLSENEINKLFMIRKTLMEMLQDRGYSVVDEERQMQKNEFLHKYGENMTRQDLDMSKTKRNDSSDKFCPPLFSNFLLEVLWQILHRIKQFLQNIVIEKKFLTPVPKLNNISLYTEFLMIQIHVFFPKEQKIGVKQIEKYMFQMISESVYNAIMVVREKNIIHITPGTKKRIGEVSSYFQLEISQEISPSNSWFWLARQLPKIQLTDPIARYYELKRGQIVKITRPSKTAGWYITYRYAV